MADRGIALEGTTVVVRGLFNPAIFTPSWFRDQDLVGVPEIEDQQIEIITPDIAVFRMGWLHCHITADVMQLSTSQPEEFLRLRDAAIGVLRLLSHTPISALGINREFHTTMATIADWHAIGDAIVPKAKWEGTLKLPGMRSALWGIRPDDYGGQVQVIVEPSQRLPQSVYVGTDDHFTLKDSGQKPETRSTSWDLTEEPVETSAEKIPMAIQVLLDEWFASNERAENARLTVIKLADGAK